MANPRTSQVFTISLPPEMAERVKEIAREESRTISELFREAFRAYHVQRVRKELDEIGEYAEAHNPHGYTEEDVPRLIKEYRAKARAKKEQALAARSSL